MRNVKIPDEDVRAFEIRMANEYQASFVYRAMRAYFERLNLNGFAKYFSKEAKGEFHHAQMIENYLADKMAEYNIPAITFAPVEFSDINTLMDKYIEMEKQTTSDLYDIDEMAEKLGDKATHSWLNAPTKNMKYALIPYQDEELKNAFDLAMEVKRITGPDGQVQGVGLNAIDARLLEG